MKNILLILLFHLSSNSIIFADGSHAMVYYANFILKDDKMIKGYLWLMSDEAYIQSGSSVKKGYSDDDGLMQLIKFHFQHENTFTVFDSIYSVPFKFDSTQIEFGCINKSMATKIQLNDIIAVKCLEVKKPTYFMLQLQYLDNQTTKWILKNKALQCEVLNLSSDQEGVVGIGTDAFLVNFNPRISDSKFKILTKKVCHRLRGSAIEGWNIAQKDSNKLRQKGIVVLYTYYGPC